MTIRCLIPTAFWLPLLCAPPALASGDYCQPSWTLDFSSLPDCTNTNVAALMPGNDTRTNLLLLLADRDGASAPTTPAPQPLLDWKGFRSSVSGASVDDASPYADGEGSRCRSDGAGKKAFSAAVAAAGLSENERTMLTDARATLSPRCESNQGAPNASASTSTDASSPSLALGGVTSTMGQAFAAYLRAADAFYAGRFAEATAAFQGLLAAPDPWLSDTAAYMLGRTAVNALQANAFDEYGTLKGSPAVDQGSAHGALASLHAYLEQHPTGLYAASARGLERRVAWLAGSTEDLAARYADLLSQPPAARGLDGATLAEEIDNKLLPNLTPAMTKDPILLATLDLKAMRRREPGAAQPPRPDLAAQRDAFAKASDLYQYLLAAAAFYEDNDPKSVIHALPDDTRRRGGDNLWFSRQMLRGLALEAVGDRNARGFWKELLPGATRPLQHAATEMALAFDEERRRDIEDGFTADSPLTDPALRAILLIHDAGPALLRARADDAGAPQREREIALFTLLRKELSHGSYADFLADAARVPPDAPKVGSVEIAPLGDDRIPVGLFVHGETAGDIACPALADTVAHLARDPNGTRDRLCLAEWIRLNHFDPDHDAIPLTKHDLGFGPTDDPGPAATRMVLYRAIIAEPAAPADERAYALYRAVKCYEPSGYNRCGDPDVAKGERHRWYDTLKGDYPRSRWARQLQFWW